MNNQHFLAVVPQPVGFCILKKWVSCCTWFIFPHLIYPFLAKGSFHWSVCLLQAEGWPKWGPLPPVERFGNSYNRLSERNIRQMIVKSLLLLHHNAVISVMCACVLGLIPYRSFWYVWRRGWVFRSLTRSRGLCLKSNYYTSIGFHYS